MDDDTLLLCDPPRRGRGRPKGGKNRVVLKQIAPGPRAVPDGLEPYDDFRHADPMTLASRQYAMFDWAQQVLRQEIKAGLGAEVGRRISRADIQAMMDLSTTLLRAMDAHKRSLALAEELAKQKTPAELLEIAIKKIMAQDLPTLQAIIRRLRDHRSLLAPITKREAKIMKDVYVTAVSAVTALGEESDEAL